jgi:hypothetical protein
MMQTLRMYVGSYLKMKFPRSKFLVAQIERGGMPKIFVDDNVYIIDVRHSLNYGMQECQHDRQEMF